LEKYVVLLTAFTKLLHLCGSSLIPPSIRSPPRTSVLHQCRTIFTARCYASAVLAMALCPSVRPSQVGFVLKRLNVGSHKQHHTIPQGLWFSDAKDLREIRPGSPPVGAPNTGGVGQNRRLLTNSRLYLENGTR